MDPKSNLPPQQSSNLTIEQFNNPSRNRIFYVALFVVTALFAIISIRTVFSPQKKDNQVTLSSSQPTLSSSSSPLSSSGSPSANTRGSNILPSRGGVLPPKQLANNQSGIALSLTPLDQTVQINTEFFLNVDFNRLESAPDAVDVILPHNVQMFEFIKAQSSHIGYALVRSMTPEGLIVLSFVKTGEITLSDGFIPKDFLRLGRVTLKALKVGKETITPVYNSSSVSTLVSYQDKVGNQLSEVQGVTIVVQ